MKRTHATVLVIEDDQALNDAYTMILGDVGGYRVLRAYNGKEALKVLEGEGKDPDIILLDLRMPVMDGIGFLKKFKPIDHPASTVVVFSNYDAHRDIDEAYALGINRYVLKARAAPKDLLHLVSGIIDEKNKE